MLISCSSTKNKDGDIDIPPKVHYSYGGKEYKVAPKVTSTIKIISREICDTVP